jgi:hypothetical protein
VFDKTFYVTEIYREWHLLLRFRYLLALVRLHTSSRWDYQADELFVFSLNNGGNR